ncbi:MAG: hypothetical protein L0Y57_13805, partial [Beijerinckiaceae bacterium]|nr:hypothetical protein [Beijerinckiaceae bacterium]
MPSLLGPNPRLAKQAALSPAAAVLALTGVLAACGNAIAERQSPGEIVVLAGPPLGPLLLMAAIICLPIGALAFFADIFRSDQKAKCISSRKSYICGYEWPQGLLGRFKEHYPTLTEEDLDLVSRGLKQFFIAYVMGEKKYVAMPSRAADGLWHEFILYTRAYEEFCRVTFGSFFHHTPALALAPDRKR